MVEELLEVALRLVDGSGHLHQLVEAVRYAGGELDQSLMSPRPDVAGGSARAKYERDSARDRHREVGEVAADQERRRQRSQKGLLGKIGNVVTPAVTIGPEPQSTKAWDTGATGEERVGEWLQRAIGVEVLHDRLEPGAKQANIDHISIGPSGVFVIDAKNFTGTVEIRDKGTFLRTDDRLYVGGRDRTNLVGWVLDQVEAVL